MDSALPFLYPSPAIGSEGGEERERLFLRGPETEIRRVEKTRMAEERLLLQLRTSVCFKAVSPRYNRSASRVLRYPASDFYSILAPGTCKLRYSANLPVYPQNLPLFIDFPTHPYFKTFRGHRI